MGSKKNTLLISLLAVGLGLLLGIGILLLSGHSPVQLFNALLRGMIGMDLDNGVFVNLRNLGELIVYAMPIILTGLSIGFAYRTGLFNIGAEGQFMVGAMASVVVAFMVPMSGPFHAILAVIAGTLAGALWGFVPGFLKSKFNIHEVVVCIMMNYSGMYLANYVVKQMPGANQTLTPLIPESASLNSDLLRSLTNNSRLNWGILFVILAVLIFWFILEKTSFGYSLRATGFNKDGARYAGLKVQKNIILSMMIAGAFAGLAGAITSLGTSNMGRVINAFENFGFDGIAVALVGACNAVGIVLAGFLFGLLKVAQPIMQIDGIPKQISEIISSSIVLFVAMQYGIQIFVGKLAKRKIDKGGNGK